MENPLHKPTNAAEFTAWATAVVETEAQASEQAATDEIGERIYTAGDYLADLRTILERIATGDIERITYPMPPDDEPDSEATIAWPPPEPTPRMDDWQYEVANGDTRLGYDDWLANQVVPTEITYKIVLDLLPDDDVGIAVADYIAENGLPEPVSATPLN